MNVLVLVLAGGKGTRIKHLLDGKPKPLAEVYGEPFLFWLLSFLRAQGFADFAFCVHYKWRQIGAFISRLNWQDCRFQLVIEESPLGTGGAVLKAIRDIDMKDFSHVLVLNGDSLVCADIGEMVTSINSDDGVILALNVEDASRYGSVETDGRGYLSSFTEKQETTGLINAGVYLLGKDVLLDFPWSGEIVSFESELFPWLLDSGKNIRVLTTTEPFLDIGTESTLNQAESFVQVNKDRLTCVKYSDVGD
jgi:D-glycero-alpha-D-manno-heptose 1-phosphate guanylyltransferase